MADVIYYRCNQKAHSCASTRRLTLQLGISWKWVQFFFLKCQMFVDNLHDKCLGTWPMGENARSSYSHTPPSFFSCPFPKLPFSHLCLLMRHWKTDSLQVPLSLLVTPRPGCVYGVYTPKQRSESVLCRVGWRARVLKNTPLLTYWVSEAWAPASSGQVSAFRKDQNKPPPNFSNCPWCVNNTSTPVTPWDGEHGS